jgi:hypothetical protein
MAIKYDNYVKRPFEEHGFEAWQIQTLISCTEKVENFIPYVKIVNPDDGEVEFEPYTYQFELLEKFQAHRFNIALLARQSGKTTAVAVFALWYACFHRDKVIGIVSNKEKIAKMILDRFKRMYESLPIWLKPGVSEYQKTGVTFDNGSRITISATTTDAFRGETLNLLICDEFAFVHRNLAQDFWAANYPTISASKKSKVIVISTPNGLGNLFHQLYMKSEKKENEFVHTKVTWRNVPGRDIEWAKRELANLGSKQKFLQEHEVEFLGSASTVIDPDILADIITKYQAPIQTDLENHLNIFEKPDNDSMYILGVDTAKGTGEHYSAIQILKIESMKPIKLIQVATYMHNGIDVYRFAQIVNRLGLYYNNAYLMVENNAEGSTVVNRLWWDFENDHLVNSGSKAKELGVRATKTTKVKAVLLMKRFIEDGSLEIKDEETLTQLTTFIEENGKFFGEPYDDLISALYWACYIFAMETKKGHKLDVIGEEWKLRKSKDEVEKEDDVWGILADIDDMMEDWSWLDEGAKVMFG